MQPEASEIRKIAAEGILTCLQDTIDTLKQEQVCTILCYAFYISCV